LRREQGRLFTAVCCHIKASLHNKRLWAPVFLEKSALSVCGKPARIAVSGGGARDPKSGVFAQRVHGV
jgi:hypothetical protein